MHTHTAPLHESLREVGDNSWRRDAACAAHPAPDLWFPENDQYALIAQAKQVCWQTCPVRRVCYNAAVDSRSVYGVWGGRTEVERRDFHRNAKNVRRDRRRVEARLAGWNVSLSERERELLQRRALELELDVPQLAAILQVTEHHARALRRKYRDAMWHAALSPVISATRTNPPTALPLPVHSTGKAA